MTDIIEAICTVGFPIVAFLLIFYQSNTTIRTNTQAIRELIIYLKGRK